MTLFRFHLQHGLQVPWLWPSGALCLWPSAQQKKFRAAARPMLAKHSLRRSCLSESRAETKFRTHHKQRGNYISIVHLDYWRQEGSRFKLRFSPARSWIFISTSRREESKPRRLGLIGDGKLQVSECTAKIPTASNFFELLRVAPVNNVVFHLLKFT